MSAGHDHGHGDVANADHRQLSLALAVIAAFMVAEIVAGIVANSLALLSDAAHMATDAASIGLALFAARMARRPPTKAFTFGLRRGEILSAQVNGISLLVLAGILGYEAVGRFAQPPDVQGQIVLVVGVAGALANVAAAWLLSRAQRRSLNVEGAMQHVLTDLYGSFAAIAAGVAVLAAGFELADPIAALIVVGLMVRSGWGLVRESGRVLLEGVPRDIDASAVARALLDHPGVVNVHDLHVWEVTTDFPSLSAHVLVGSADNCHEVRRELEAILRNRFHIEHTTLQVDHAAGDELLQISRPRR